MNALYRGLAVSAVLALIAFYPITVMVMGDNGVYSVNALYGAAVIGLLLTAALVWITSITRD